MGLDQVRHKFGNQMNALSVVAPIDREVLALDEAKPPKFIESHEPIGRIAWTDGHAAEAISPARFLGRCSVRWLRSNSALGRRCMMWRRVAALGRTTAPRPATAARASGGSQ